LKDKYSITDFKVRAKLGEGAFGLVFLVELKETGKQYAMKVLDKSQIFANNTLKYTKAERDILAMTDHPYIVKLYFAF